MEERDNDKIFKESSARDFFVSQRGSGLASRHNNSGVLFEDVVAASSPSVLSDISFSGHNKSVLGKDKIRIHRYFTKEGVHPYDELKWEKRSAKISSSKGEVIFQQDDVEVPIFWSQSATDIVAEKYFSGHIGKPGREASVRQLIDRVTDTIARWGIESDYFASQKDAIIFNEELKSLLANQRGSFNSPVWFNVGVEKKPQCSACFILNIEDSKESISEWYKTEMFIFSGGSGAGINLSPLRSSRESITNRGKSSGPVSFMKGADAIAGTIRSGGKTRRAAKMVILNADHPDIKEFIVCKWKEEKKAKALLSIGYDDALDGEIYNNIFFQNANNSVRVTDEFMRAAENDEEWNLRYVKTGDIAETVRAKDLMRLIAEAAWNCADPGIQFDTTINNWHTCSNTARINGSNPCSEYMHLDNSACNLASLNLLKFLKMNGEFDIDAYKCAIRLFILAQDIIVEHSSYPTEKIAQNAANFRQLGLGYTNLGALLMQWGLPYDSDIARAYTGVITAILTGEAYRTSTEISAAMGAFNGYEKNKEPILNVFRMHRDEAKKINDVLITRDLKNAAVRVWEEACQNAEKVGVRNSQATVLAPTGTISFMMDCDTTGIEPGFSLVAYKKMVGGGFLKLVNQSVDPALRYLGYSEIETKEIINYIMANDTIEGSPHIKESDMPVFDCATNAPGGKRSIHYLGHIRMMAAAQPFISGAISKTVNLPESATIEDIMDIYVDAWKMGLKAIAIYRDNSKGTQVLNTSSTKTLKQGFGGQEEAISNEAPPEVQRKKMPADVKSTRHKFSIAGHEGYIHCGMYEDGTLGEVFIRVAKEGSTISGLLDAIGILMSISLQSGVPINTIIKKLVHSRFEPAGYTDNPDIVVAKSILDYIAKYLAIQFLNAEERTVFGIYTNADHEKKLNEQSVQIESMASESKIIPKIISEATIATTFSYQDAPSCRCGSLMIRTGSCYTCPSCGENIGSCS